MKNKEEVKKEAKKGFGIRTYLNEELNTRVNNNMQSFTTMYGFDKKSAFFTVALNYFCSVLEKERAKVGNKELA